VLEIFAANREDSKNPLSIINLFYNSTIPGDIWTVGKKLIELFESIDHVACKFPGFFSTLAVKDKIIVLETGFAE
jgi:hypothetical protein